MGGSKSNFFIPLVRKIKPQQSSKHQNEHDLPTPQEEEIAILYKLNRIERNKIS
jgi:hypothetical protein